MVKQLATTTLKASVSAALDLRDKSAGKAYIAIGRITPWDKETSPPQPDYKAEDIEEIIGFKKVDTIQLVAPINESNTIATNIVNFDGMRWEIIQDKDALEREAVYVYYSTTLDNSDFGNAEYRQVGLYLNTVPTENKTTLLPEDVENNGDLYFVSNRVPQVLGDSIRVQENFVISTLPRAF